MSDTPSKLKYTKSHEWLREEQDDIATIGITHHAQELLGDIVYVELPEISNTFSKQSECAVVESVKAAADIYMPVDGEIIEVNEQLADSPELVNQQPFKDGWLFKIKIKQREQLGELLDHAAYDELAAESES